MNTLAKDPEKFLDQKMQHTGAETFKGIVKGFSEFQNFSKGTSDLQKWVEQHRIIYGKNFSYENADIKQHLGKRDKLITRAPRPYLKQYINDKCDDKTVIKCRQSEFTEQQINKNIYLAANIPHIKVRHIFPTAGVANKMAKEKISPAITGSPKINELLRRPINLTSKEFINGSFYTVDSSWNDFGGRGPSSDVLVFDEYESQNPQIEEIFAESLTHSKLGIKDRISTPLLPNAGIDLRYLEGCQYEWFVTCPKCKHEQMMSFPDNIIHFFDMNTGDDLTDENYLKKLEKVYIGCKKCGAYLDRTSDQYVKNARWVPRKKHLAHRRASYRVTYMMLPWKTGMEILTKYHSFMFKHQFWNEVMGFAYVDPTAVITRQMFLACIDNGYRNSIKALGMARNVSIGVDWGIVSWVVIRANGFPPNTTYPRVIYVERIDEKSLKDAGYEGKQTDHAKRVAELIKIFQAKIIVNDANGIGVDRNSYLVDKFPTRAYGCFYDTDEIQKQKRKDKLIKNRWSEANNTVTVSRLNTFKRLVQEYEMGKPRITLPALDPDVDEFITHHANLVIQKMADEKTGEVYEIVGKTGPDHFGHADNYSRIGFSHLVNVEREGNAGVVIPSAGKAGKVAVSNYVGNPDLDF